MDPPTHGTVGNSTPNIEMAGLPDSMKVHRSEECEQESKLSVQRSPAGRVINLVNSFSFSRGSEQSSPAVEPVSLQQTHSCKAGTEKSLKSRVEQLEFQLDNKNQEFKQEIRNRDRMISNLKRKISENEDHIWQLRCDSKDYNTTLAQCHNELESQEHCIRQLKNHISSLSQDLDAMQNANEELQDKLHVTQERTLRSMKNTWIPKEDEAVRNEFSRLEEKLKAWAKKYAVSDIDSLRALSDNEKREITDHLNGNIAPESLDALLEKMSPSLRKRFPILITHAMLAKRIFSGIFDNPFFALRQIGNRSEIVSGFAMSRLYKSMIKVSPAEAHIWRSQMLRLLAASPPDSSQAPLLSLQVLQICSTQMSKKFLRGPVSLLLNTAETPEIQDKCKQDLYRVFASAMELSASLWCQRTEIDCRCILLNERRRFFQEDQAMVAHRLHHLDEDDDRLDGKEILAIIQPAVFAFGNEDAENYDKWKIWSRALVLIDEGDN